MAQKRMFDKGLLETDDFMDMPMSTKALYFLLGMEADDEGFVSPKRVLRLYGGTDDDVNVLLAKNYIIKFQSGVVVITDWLENNYLDKNRIKETKYINEKRLLGLSKTKYTMLNGCLTDVKPEESRVEESRVEENTDFFSKNPSLSNSFVSPEKLTSLEVKNKTHKDFANALRAEKGNPPLEVKKLTLNQIDFFARSKLIDYYKQAVNSKYNKNYFTNPLDISDIEKENSKMSMMIKIFYQRCGDDKMARDVIDYYAGDYGKFFEWKPNGLFRKDTIIDFENRKNKPNKNNTIKLYGKEWQF